MDCDAILVFLHEGARDIEFDDFMRVSPHVECGITLIAGIDAEPD